MSLVWKKQLQEVETAEYGVTARWEETCCCLALTNKSDHVLKLHKTAVLKMDMPFGADTSVYGEGYNKLCQYGGTVKKLNMTGSCGDYSHYKLPVPKDFHQVYNMIRFTEESGKCFLLGFSSCRRFSGEFWFNEEKLLVILNLEGIEILQGETVALETLFAGEGTKEETQASFAAEIQVNHPMLRAEEIPTGWCSGWCMVPM